MENSQEEIKIYREIRELEIPEGILRGLVIFREKDGHAFETELRTPDGQLVYYQNAELFKKLSEYLEKMRGQEKIMNLMKSLAENQNDINRRLKDFINKQENFLVDDGASKMNH